ncbi:MAG: aspartate-semialdehyde dehydrogenase, partial [Gammaproteobacteria bacterium]|nr:aspartate-semialdehyde dehydrogenase [Gammaproteobacteria bacterium]
LYPVASKRSAGDTLLFAKKAHLIEDLAEFDFSQVDIALFSAGGSISKEYAPLAAAKDCIVIDNTSEFRNEDDIPLIVPEVNPDAIADYTNRNIIANPNCSTIQMLVALKPIHDTFGIKKIDVSTYQSVSGSGKSGINELAGQTGKLLNGLKVEPEAFSQQIAFNVLPQIDVFMENGFTREEMKMIWETRKIFGDNDIIVNPTAVRVPVFYGHSEAIHIETKKPITREAALNLLRSAEGVIVVDSPEKELFATPVTHSAGKNAVFVSRVREQLDCDTGLNLWVVSDNIRKGAALNSVQIAEKLIQSYL